MREAHSAPHGNGASGSTPRTSHEDLPQANKCMFQVQKMLKNLIIAMVLLGRPSKIRPGCQFRSDHARRVPASQLLPRISFLLFKENSGQIRILWLILTPEHVSVVFQR